MTTSEESLSLRTSVSPKNPLLLRSSSPAGDRARPGSKMSSICPCRIPCVANEITDACGNFGWSRTAATVALLPIKSVVSSNKSFDANASNSALAPGRGLRSASRLLLFRAILESSLNATELAFLLPENAGAPTPKKE